VSSFAPVPAAVVYDINVLVTAAASGNSPFRSWPSPPPVSGNASADCLGIIVDAAEFALWLSPHIITNIDRILAQLFKWAQPQIDAYLRAVGMAAEHSGAGIVADVPRTVHDCPDHEDNLILNLTVEVGRCSSSPTTPICCPCRRGAERPSSSRPRSPQRPTRCAGTHADDADRP
jgi:hypothetical protein